MPVKILAILQNQWFKDPEKVRAMYDRHPDLRNDLIKRFLFLSCRSGQILRTAFGEDLCNRIIWEEASPEIGSYAGFAPKPDLDHIRQAVAVHAPDVVVALGAIAARGVRAAFERSKPDNVLFLQGPHPTARQDTRPALETIAKTLREIKEKDQ